MNKVANGHQSVLINESLAGLAIIADGIYIDATFGRGGHSAAILAQLNNQGRLIAIDKDPAAIAYFKQRFASDPRCVIYQDSFAAIKALAEQQQVIGKVNGILLDLGLSSPQLDEAQRGFSFMQDGPLDMRMNPDDGLDAATWINAATQAEMADVFHKYGEERFAKRIASKIVEARAQVRITNTLQLANIIKQANPAWEKHKHPATRCFQAIRIFINHELHDLEAALAAIYAILAPRGRLVVISFHSLEDRIVKRFLRQQEQGKKLPAKLPIPTKQLQPAMKRIGKAIKPSSTEVNANSRARSAILRIGEKVL